MHRPSTTTGHHSTQTDDIPTAVQYSAAGIRGLCFVEKIVVEDFSSNLSGSCGNSVGFP